MAKKCDECKGLGKVWSSWLKKMITCDACGGTGKRPEKIFPQSP